MKKSLYELIFSRLLQMLAKHKMIDKIKITLIPRRLNFAQVGAFRYPDHED